MIFEAISHTPLSKDAYALDEQNLVLRIRTGKNDIQECNIFFGDRVCMTEPIEVSMVCMEKIASDEYFDYYEAKIKSPYTRVCYYFQLTGTDGMQIYYSEYGITKEMNCHRTEYFQFPYMHRQDLIKAPEWTKNMVMYHIFPDSFADGGRHISGSGKHKVLPEGIESVSNNGGTLQGIMENLDYIQDLHVNCLYLNPIFMAESYHKYDTIDYYEIDPCFGTKNDLKNLVAKCHERGIKVILDGVFNHCGKNFFAFRDVLAYGEKSPYRDWFYKLDFPVKCQVPPNYEAFAYVPEMPKLNTANSDVEDYFCNVGRYWIREADIDGWRLDVANEINHDFWRAFRKAVRKEKSDAFLIGEIWEDGAVWLQGDQFDSTMNYNFSYICKEFFAFRTIRASQFAERICRMNLRYPETVAMMQMNFLDTHDVPRFLSYCDGDRNRLQLAVLFMMTAQGIPSVFYGDEYGVEGMTESEYRAKMPWGEQENYQHFFAELAEIRRKHPALCTGYFRVICTNDEKNVIVFMRQSAEEKLYVIINNGYEEWEFGQEPLNGISCHPMSGRIVGEDGKSIWAC